MNEFQKYRLAVNKAQIELNLTVSNLRQQTNDKLDP